MWNKQSVKEKRSNSTLTPHDCYSGKLRHEKAKELVELDSKPKPTRVPPTFL